MTKPGDVFRDKLVTDFKALMADTEELLRLTAGEAGEKFNDARTRLGKRLDEAKERLADAESALTAQTRKVADATDDYVHKNPWQAVGMAAGVAFLLGLLAGRK